jgi:iron-sulfur cluster assembly accessory protein
MINLTQAAQDKIHEIADDGLIRNIIIRVKLLGGGCGGFQPQLDFEQLQLDTDEEILFGDIKIIIDPLSHQYLEETTIDYSETLMGGGFKFDIPKATSSCGCNKSYSF